MISRMQTKTINKYLVEFNSPRSGFKDSNTDYYCF